MRTQVRWRGGQVTRIEALTDAVFGFAITLLVVSLEAPANFTELSALMRGFIPFAFSFALLILVWSYHYRLFSRYDLDDGYTIFLNSVLLFVVLFYVYPLKFVASFLLSGRSGQFFESWEQVPAAMTMYGFGFVAVFVVFALLYLHAYKSREHLELDPVNALGALQRVSECLVMAAVGLLSVIIAQTWPGDYAAAIAGFAYFLIGPLQYANGAYFGKRVKQLIDGNVAVAP